MEQSIAYVLTVSIKSLIKKLLSVPFSTITTHILTHDSPTPTLYSRDDLGILTCITDIMQQEGIFGFYKFLGAEYLLDLFEIALTQELKTYSIYKSGNPNLLGLSSRVFGLTLVRSIFTYPFKLMETKYICQRNESTNQPKFAGIADVFFHIFDKEGILGFYRGFVLKVVLDWMWSVFITYAMLYKMEKKTTQYDLHLRGLNVLLWVVHLPLEVVQYQMQMLAGEESKFSEVDVFKRIYRRGGLMGYLRAGVLRARLPS